MEFLATIMTDGKPVNDQYEVTWTDDLGNKLQVRFRLVTSRKLSFLLNTSNLNFAFQCNGKCIRNYSR